MKKKIVLLLSQDCFSNIIYHALKKDFDIVGVLLDEPVSKKKIIKGRIKRLGFLHVILQLFFQIFIVKILKIKSRQRIKQIIADNSLIIAPINNKIVKYKGVINNQRAIDIIKELSPDLIFVNGTRILNKKLINSVNAIMINMHAGITPNYRGVHGAYWALYNRDTQNVGTTIHYIDAGIDTGEIIMQENIQILKDDNFVTYPYLQVSVGILMLRQVIKKLLKGEQINFNKIVTSSHLYYHPTIVTYLRGIIFRKVK